VLHGLRYLFDALIDRTHTELGRRAETLKPLWKQYYGQISSHAHFQDVDMEVRQNHTLEDPLTAFWSAPYRGRTVRFLVSDPEAKKKSKVGLPMQALLSEGQLNCAIVALALALSDVQAPPFKLIALDDPFVSWDDVNMENFLAAIRDLAWKNWTVILSTCDERVVTSFRKNMETLGEEFAGITYTFRDWDREHGPRVDFARLPARQSKSLRDLSSEVCEYETLKTLEEGLSDYEADIWIVPLSGEPLQPGHSLTFQEIPFTLQKYYYPASSKRRLRTKYIGFRFDGRLQAYARIVRTRTIPNFDHEIPGLSAPWAGQPHVVVELADLKLWPRKLRSGPIRNRHAYCDWDLLEESQSLMEADRLSAERRRSKRG
jgi:ABC-type lipoprotein export system ATPase subunit